jgi:hypothetical protein
MRAMFSGVGTNVPRGLWQWVCSWSGASRVFSAHIPEIRWGVADRNPPRSKLRPSRNGKVRSCREEIKQPATPSEILYLLSSLPFREGRHAVTGWVPIPPNHFSLLVRCLWYVFAWRCDGPRPAPRTGACVSADAGSVNVPLDILPSAPYNCSTTQPKGHSPDE